MVISGVLYEVCEGVEFDGLFKENGGSLGDFLDDVWGRGGHFGFL